MRVEGWEKIAQDYLQVAAETPFVWGSADCVLFASDLVKAMTGIDPAIDVRGRYASKEEAQSLVEYEKPEFVIGKYFKKINPKLAQRGDIVLKKTDEGFSFGIIWDGRAFFRTETSGLLKLKVAEDMLAWRIG